MVPGVAAVWDLLVHEQAELAVELGGAVEVVRIAPVAEPGPSPTPPPSSSTPTTPTLRLEIDPRVTVPVLRRHGDLVRAIGASFDETLTALNLIRTMRRTALPELRHEPAATLEDAVQRLAAEVVTTWPSFARTGIDPRRWAEEGPAVVDAPDPVAGMQRWVARLGDGHTNVHARSDTAALPYTARAVGGRLWFVDVPAGTPIWEAGVRPGDEILGIAVDDVGSRAGAPPHLRPWLVGRRALSGPVGQPLGLEVRRADGSVVTVEDVPGSSTWPEPVTWHRLPSGTGVLRIRRWLTSDADTLDAALADLAGAERLIVDLRGNAGGALMAAVAFRRRFVPHPARLGSVRFSTGDGGLSPVWWYEDTPADGVTRTARTRFLTDGLTYSASEDALLGLRQFDHIDVAGWPSGGGSGRPRTVPLFDAAVLTVSTALTYDHDDHDGRSVEGRGITVDHPLPPDAIGDAALTAADQNW